MDRRLCILCFLLALWPVLAPAELAALTWREAYNVYKALNAQGRYAKAERFAQKALELGEEKFGPDHPTTGTLLNNLALLYQRQGHYADAEPLYKRALAIYEKAHGPEHAHVATNLNNLADLYQKQGRYSAAEPLYKRALAIREKALGPEHPSVATTFNNLAFVYQKQGRFAEAEPLYRRAVAIWEKALSTDHPSIVTSLNNLARLYQAQGRFGDAEHLYTRVLAIVEKARGSGNAAVATSLNNLVGLYKLQGRFSAAVPLQERSLAIQENALGRYHRQVAASVHNLAYLYDRVGRYAAAEPLFERAAAIWEKTVGPNHPELANTLYNLASLYHAQRRYGEAEPLYRRCLSIRQKALGPNHPLVVATLDDLALVSLTKSKVTRDIGEGLALSEVRHGVFLVAVPQLAGVKYDITLVDQRIGLDNIRKALDLLVERSPFSADKINILKKNGNVVIVYDPSFPFEVASTLGTKIAGFISVGQYYEELRGRSKKYIDDNKERAFLTVVSRYGAKWPPDELASIIAHELVGHGMQHLHGRLDVMRELDVECEASLYEDAVQWDLGINKKSTEMVAFRNNLERYYCSGLKKYMANSNPSLLKLWDVLRLDVPRILAVFEEYMYTLRAQQAVR
jgi:tetratricopeptide (TPR) repeat protein